jgi:hypothetical protein
MAKRREVRIAPDVDRMLRTCLHARVAFPTEIWLDVEGTAVGGIDVHDVGRADIHAMSAAVATSHVNEGWHDVLLSSVLKTDVGPINNVASA